MTINKKCFFFTKVQRSLEELERKSDFFTRFFFFHIVYEKKIIFFKCKIQVQHDLTLSFVYPIETALLGSFQLNHFQLNIDNKLKKNNAVVKLFFCLWCLKYCLCVEFFAVHRINEFSFKILQINNFLKTAIAQGHKRATAIGSKFDSHREK